MPIINHKGGIYRITNLINNKIYIGQSKNLTTRFRQHLYELKNNRHHNSHLQNTYNIVGKKAFKFDILEECTIEERDDRERYWIDYYKSTDPQFGYNYQSGGCDTRTISEETKQKIIKALTGRPVSLSTRLKIGDANRGRVISEEGRANMVASNSCHPAWNKGIPPSEEQIEKQRVAMTGKVLGPCSEERKIKIGNANRGKTSWAKDKHKSDEFKQLLSEKFKGRTYSDETLKRMSEGQKGKTLSEETKRKISEAQEFNERRVDTTPEMLDDLKCGISRRQFQSKYNCLGPWRRYKVN